MHAGAGQHRTDRDVSIHHVQVQLVTDPAFLMPLAVAFAAHGAGAGQVGQILGQGARRLEFQPFGRSGRADFSPPGTTALLRHRRSGRGFGRGLFGRFDGGGVKG